MTLQQIGFYTLNDDRAKNASPTSPLKRCELVLTGRCNFRCPYCRRVGGPDIDLQTARKILQIWAADGLNAVRFSGGEPTLHPHLVNLVRLARNYGIERIAVSSNGSASQLLYDDLIAAGVNDFSISLDACCAEDGDKMTGGVKGTWSRVVDTIRFLAARVYTTVGIVLTAENADQVQYTVALADKLGVTDIRVIPAAQADYRLRPINLSAELLAKHPILKYRMDNVAAGRPVRGLRTFKDPHRCGLVVDDMACDSAGYHYPCIIYMREGGDPIGHINDLHIRHDRAVWSETHDCQNDPICKKNCLDVCVDYNRTYERFHPITAEDCTRCESNLDDCYPASCFIPKYAPPAPSLVQLA